jgi:lipopolysaccharide biosynthesis glycosyltransferase
MIEVAVAGDANIAAPFMAMMQTLMESIRDVPVRAHVIDTGLQSLTGRRLQAMSKASAGRFQVRWVSLTAADWGRLPKTKNYPRENFMRLILPELLPELNQVMWLDCDLLICEDLAPLWLVPAANSPIVAVPEYGGRNLSRMLAPALLDMLPETSRSLIGFNAGIMTMNLTAWRERALGTKSLELCEQLASVLSFPDQEVLNTLCAGEWKAADLRWNVQLGAIRSIPRVPAEKLSEPMLTQVDELMEHPAIIHFAGDKPWSSGIKNPFRDLFFQSLKRSRYFNEFAFQRYKAASTWTAIGSFVKKRWLEQKSQQQTKF